ncbi:polyprenyl synthetase family protein [Loktanella sp. SALINAS62]|uniref:polyprenyl synthetase family protein n=1 Tax=Loktanella sp. SALINAS62 TaxID=2706124 RepID=UPI001B8AE0AA|nr:polyprenyl synthetase family protein [Loktanella sp. SALINAS62]MBS1302609.1 polyprenyl synthetase family protein [Loktanella sp. SALINAS62]
MFDMARRCGVSVSDVEAEMMRLVSFSPSRVTEAARYHLAGGGSRVRAQMGIEAAAALRLSPEASIACAAASELLHNASLVHDDLQDGDEIRRGAAAVWSCDGSDVAVSTGDLLISAAYMALAHHPRPVRALHLMHQAIAVTIAGQTKDCSADIPTPKDWVTIAEAKSGPLLAMPIQLALIAAGASGQTAAACAGRALAVAYQTVDDIADRTADLANRATNICLSLEKTGLSSVDAVTRARELANRSLHAVRQDACRLPDNAGASFLRLADKLEGQLKDIANAT